MFINKYLFLFTLTTFSFFLNATAAKNEVVPVHKIGTIVLDAGHGGNDNGARYFGKEEKNIVLDVVLRLGKLINQNLSDVKVVYTRDQDVFIPLHQRADIANRDKADLFVSVHANACPSSSIYGAETYVLGLHRSQENLAVAEKENSVILLESDHTTRYEGFDPNSPESYVVFELVQDQYLNQSIDLATKIQKSFSSTAERINRGVKQAGFLVLRRTAMPSVLIEIGYLTNQHENEYLSSESGRQFIAQSIFNAIKEYKIQEDSKISTLKVPQNSTENETVIKEEPKTVVNQNPHPTPAITNTPVYNHESSDSIFSYTIQLFISSRNYPLNAKNFKGLDSVKKYKSGKSWKYCYSEATDFNQIKIALDKIRRKYPDAFIIGLEKGQPVSLQRILQQLH